MSRTAKYQRLSKEELENLREDFIRFIASQGIDAEAWVKMKEESIEQADELIDIYSDLVWDQALNKCQYLEHISAKEFKAIHFTDDKALVYGLRVKEGSDLNLNTDAFQDVVNKGLSTNEIELFTASKSYEKERETEMFTWIQQGGYMSDQSWYSELQRLEKHLKDQS